MGYLLELQNSFLETLRPHIEDRGFKYRKSYRDFIKKFKEGRKAFHITIINHSEDFDATADFAIRFDEVEDVLNSEKKLITEKEKKETYTIGCEVGNWTVGRQRRWSFFDKEDISRNTETILHEFDKTVLPFFESYQVPEKVISSLQDEKRSRLICPFIDRHGQLIKLLKNLNSNKTRDQIAGTRGATDSSA